MSNHVNNIGSDDTLQFNKYCLFISSVDDRLCVQQDILLIENAPFSKNYTQDGLFCIYFDNCKCIHMYRFLK